MRSELREIEALRGHLCAAPARASSAIAVAEASADITASATGGICRETNPDAPGRAVGLVVVDGLLTG
jgi:hypothetical protein